jgi:hypothetical protein
VTAIKGGREFPANKNKKWALMKIKEMTAYFSWTWEA